MRSPSPGPALLLGALLATTGCAGGIGAMVPRLAGDTDATRESVDLPKPQGVRAGGGEVRRVFLEWDPILGGDVGGYRIERAVSPNGPFEPVGIVADRFTTTFVDGSAPSPMGLGDDASLDDGVTVHYRVRATTPDGRLAAEASIPVPGSTAPAPRPPDGFRVFSHQPRRVPISWSPSKDPSVGSYVLYRSPAESGPFEPIAVLDDRLQATYVDEGLGDLRVFYYRVAARNIAGGEGEPSGPARAVTKPVPLPPVGLRVIERRLGSNRLGWDANVEPDLEGYLILRQRSAGGKREPVGRVDYSRTTAEDRDVAPGEEISYTLRAFDRSGLQSVRAPSLAVVSADYDLEAAARTDGVHLRWNPREEEGYGGARVEREGPEGRRDLGRVDSGQLSDPEVTPGATYRYVVTLEWPDGTPTLPSRPLSVTVPTR